MISLQKQNKKQSPKKEVPEKQQTLLPEKQQTLLQEPEPSKLTVLERCKEAPMDYMEISINMAGSVAFQKVGGSLTFRTSDPELLPETNSKEDICEAIQGLFDRSGDGVSLLVDRIKEGLMVLKEYRDDVEG